jgi:chemotaxis signal transduction protein
MASGHQAGTTDHELKWQQIQPPKTQAKHSLYQQGTTDHELKWQQIQPPKKQAKRTASH